MPSLSGRLVNFLSTRFPGVGQKGTQRQIAQFRASGGTKGNKIMGKPTFILDVVGRASGESRPVMLMLIRRGDDLVICGSYGGHPSPPNWYKNLMAAGEARVELGTEAWTVTPKELPEGAEREEAWKLLVAGYPDFASYQQLTDRRLPVIILERVTN